MKSDNHGGRSSRGSSRPAIPVPLRRNRSIHIPAVTTPTSTSTSIHWERNLVGPNQRNIWPHLRTFLANSRCRSQQTLHPLSGFDGREALAWKFFQALCLADIRTTPGMKLFLMSKKASFARSLVGAQGADVRTVPATDRDSSRIASSTSSRCAKRTYLSDLDSRALAVGARGLFRSERISQ